MWKPCQRTVIVVLVQIACLALVCAADPPPQEKNIWEQVKRSADAAGDSKAIWRELKKLSPQDLLICGRQFCEAMEAGPEKVNVFSLVMTTNAMLSYHENSVGYEKTAEAVGTIIANADCASWVYGCMEWIENNEHYRHIPEAGMHAIAEGIIRSIDNRERIAAVQIVVLKKLTSRDLLRFVTKADWNQIITKCRALIARGGDDKVVQRAKKSLASVERWLKDNPDEPPIKINLSLALSSEDLSELGWKLLRSYDLPTRRAAVKLLVKLENTKRASRACLHLVRWYDREPDVSLKKEIVQTVLRLDRDGKIREELLRKEPKARVSGFWAAAKP